MNILVIWLTIITTSIAFAILSYVSVRNPKSRALVFMEIWRHFINYFITAIILYYFIAIRWVSIRTGLSWNLSDFILGSVFIFGATGWLPYLIKFATESIGDLMKKVADKV